MAEPLSEDLATRDLTDAELAELGAAAVMPIALDMAYLVNALEANQQVVTLLLRQVRRLRAKRAQWEALRTVTP